eukprot:1487975-Rhodomonas_salina.2
MGSTRNPHAKRRVLAFGSALKRRVLVFDFALDTSTVPSAVNLSNSACERSSITGNTMRHVRIGCGRTNWENWNLGSCS